MPLSGRKSFASAKASLLMKAPAWLAAPRAIVSVIEADLRAVRWPARSGAGGHGTATRHGAGMVWPSMLRRPVRDWADDRDANRAGPDCAAAGRRRGDARAPRPARRGRAVAAERRIRHRARGRLGP